MSAKKVIQQFITAAQAIAEDPTMFANEGMDFVLLGAALGVSDRFGGKPNVEVAACFADVAWAAEPRGAVDAMTRRVQGG